MATSKQGQRAVDTAIGLLENGEDCTGICLNCNHTQSGVEPDAERYDCESCDASEVFGAEQIILCFGGI